MILYRLERDSEQNLYLEVRDIDGHWHRIRFFHDQAKAVRVQNALAVVAELINADRD